MVFRIRFEDTVKEARAILDAGFDAIKLKVGRAGLEDVVHVAAVRELDGPDIAIKMDSNQGWDYPTAVANVNTMKSFKPNTAATLRAFRF